MSDVKIPGGPAGKGVVDALQDAAEGAVEGASPQGEVGPVEQAAGDAVARVAEQVAAGQIGRTEAVEALLAEVLDSEPISAAPPGLREELGAALEALLETDPHLRALAARLGPEEG